MDVKLSSQGKEWLDVECDQAQLRLKAREDRLDSKLDAEIGVKAGSAVAYGGVGALALGALLAAPFLVGVGAGAIVAGSAAALVGFFAKKEKKELRAARDEIEAIGLDSWISDEGDWIPMGKERVAAFAKAGSLSGLKLMGLLPPAGEPPAKVSLEQRIEDASRNLATRIRQLRSNKAPKDMPQDTSKTTLGS